MFDLELQLQKIILKAPLLKQYIEWLKFESSNKVNIAATDGKTVFYNLDTMSQRSEDEQQFILIHEILHVALSHMERSKKIEDVNHQCFNYATDAVINQMIEKFGIPIPKDVINCPDAKDYSAEEYYDLVINRPDFNDLMEKTEKETSDSNNKTSHNMWNNEPENEKQQSNEESESEEEQQSNDNSQSETEEEQKSEEKSDSKFDEEKRQEEKPTTFSNEKDFVDKNDEEIEKAMEQFFDDMEKSSTNGYDETSESLGPVGSESNAISWEELLVGSIQKNMADYDFFSGQYDENGIWYYPYGTAKENIAEVEVLIDTSYSVNEDLVKAFLREVKSIAKHATVKIGCFNTRFDGFVEIKDESDIDNFVITSRGGTDFELAVRSFQNPSATRIVFTDGYANSPGSFCEAIWVVYSDAILFPPGGVVCRVDDRVMLKNGALKV